MKRTRYTYSLLCQSRTGAHAYGPYRTRKEARKVAEFYMHHFAGAGARTEETTPDTWQIVGNGTGLRYSIVREVA